MRTPAQGSSSRGIGVATALAACVLALTPWAAQAQAGTKAQAQTGTKAQTETPWKLALPLSEAASMHFWDVDARSRTDAWAVGQKTRAFSVEPVAKRWDGTRWSDVQLASTGGRPAQLERVAASGPDDVWVAGTYTDVGIPSASSAKLPDRLADRLAGRPADSPADRSRGGDARPAAASPIVLQHWDGTRWKRVQRPAPAEGWIRTPVELTSLGRDSVWLTTMDWNPVTNAYTGQLEHWDGRTWRRTALPSAPDGSPVLPWAITGTGPDDVWVTADADADGTVTPLLYHFDGRRWTVDSIPVPYEYDAGWVANKVVTTKRGTVHVFGKTNDPVVSDGLLAARWDGRTWRPVPAPDVEEVSASGTDGSGAVWIAGWPAGGGHAVLSRWDGVSWTKEQLPEEITATVGSSLSGIDGVPGTRAVLAAGNVACESTTGACGLVVSRQAG
ncbi:hypothetical protein [Streptomyces cavernae]|uniref:hypothetical protein n=1 Tax=Streptomyces cavernae TaxID=2259034 RepID=UPI001EE42E48|nr:hypothetical protein [Streptomyces cavernae]